jgi:very-short-patch-repair endonuclease
MMESKSKYHIRYDWSLIQKDHDDGMSWRQLQEKYGVHSASIIRAKKRGDFISRCRSDAAKIYPRSPLSEEHKQKLSISRKKYLKEHPDKVPYKLNHYSKGQSYPESYFENWLKNEGIFFIPEQQVSIYSIDFRIGNIALEIDGEQHYVDERIVKSNFYRDEYLKSLGVDTIRVRWAHYQKLSDEEKKNYLNNLLFKLKK